MSLSAWEDKWAGPRQIATLVTVSIAAALISSAAPAPSRSKRARTRSTSEATGHAGPHGRSPRRRCQDRQHQDAHGHKLAVTSTTAITGRISIDTDPDHRELRVNGNLMTPTLESDYFPLLPGLNTTHPHRSHRRQSRVQATHTHLGAHSCEYMIFDRWGNPLGDLPYAIKAIRTRATDGTDTLDITTIGEINKDERIVFKDSLNRWAEYLCQSTQTARAAGMPVTVAYCTGSIAELSRTYIEDKRNRNANAKACLAKALEGTRWAVGTVETGTLTGTADLAFYHCTRPRSRPEDRRHLRARSPDRIPARPDRQPDRPTHHPLLEHRGSTSTTKRFEYGKDLTQIKRDIDSGDVITRLYGWGKGIEQTNEEGEATGGYGRKISFADVNNGKPYIQDDNALANWGIVGADGTKHHSEASADFPDCEDPKELLNLTKAALRPAPRPSSPTPPT